MKTTPNLGLRKPEDTDLYDIENFNYNMDILDARVAEQSGGVTTGTAIGVSKGTKAAVKAAAAEEG